MQILPYDKNLVGDFLALGGENIVYRYGDDRVIKFPFGIRYLIDRKRYCAKIKKGFEISKKYFSSEFPETELKFFGKDDRQFVVIQKKIDGKHLSRSQGHLKDSNIRGQFVHMLEVAEVIEKKEHIVVDFFGGWRLLFAGIMHHVRNVFIDRGLTRLYIVDFGAFDVPGADAHFLVKIIERWAIERQKKLIKYMLS